MTVTRVLLARNGGLKNKYLDKNKQNVEVTIYFEVPRKIQQRLSIYTVSVADIHVYEYSMIICTHVHVVTASKIKLTLNPEIASLYDIYRFASTEISACPRIAAWQSKQQK